MSFKKNKQFFVASFIVLLLSLLTANTAYTFQDIDKFFPEFRHDADMTAPHIPDNFSNKSIQLGGWTTPIYISDSDSSSWSFTNALRLWGKVYLWNNSFLYARGKYTFTRTEQEIVSSIEPNQNIITTNHLIDLDIAMLDAKFLHDSIKLTAGRKYFLVGSGFLLNGRGDGAQLEWFNNILNVNVFGAYTGFLQKDDNPYNLSNRDYADGAKRLFVGTQIGQTFFNQNVYLMGMVQRDCAPEIDDIKHYNSNYYGIGLRGVFLGNFDYIGEFFYKNGSTYNYSDMSKTTISAMSAIATLNWNIDIVTLPMLTFQYAFGSGDNDRIQNSTAPDGNLHGKDNQFFNFGTFLAGYGLRPMIGNLHVARAGFGFSPFERSKMFFIRDINILAKYSYYMKDKANSSVSSFYSGIEKLGEGFIGQGVDVSLRWRMFLDLSFFANYGLFLPGDAYQDNAKSNTFLMFGMNLSF